jgi:HD-like signal output (HDOD) protein
MSAVKSAPAAATTAETATVDELIESIAIPPRPALLTEVQKEMAADDPDLGRVSRLVGMDVAMTAAVLRSVNSPFYALARKASTLDQAIALLGLRQIGTLVTGFAMRQALRGDAANLTRFWDVSTKRSYALSRLARGLRGVEADVAQSFGLFCDVGIPLLMQRFPDYAATLRIANQSRSQSFTAVEQAAHRTDHALIGALMARSWGLPAVVCDAIRAHHDYGVFQDAKVPEGVQRLIAMGLLAEVAIQRFAGLNASLEWLKGGDPAAGVLLLGEYELEDWIETLLEGFASGLA